MSPTVLVTPRPDSVNADAHWHIAISLAPAAVIITAKIQKVGFRKISRMGAGALSPPRVFIGTSENITMFTSGKIAHAKDIYRHAETPKTTKNAVDTVITIA